MRMVVIPTPSEASFFEVVQFLMTTGTYSVVSLLQAIAGPPPNDFTILFTTGLLSVTATDTTTPPPETSPGETLQLTIGIGPISFPVTATYAGVPQETQGTADNVVVGFSIPLAIRVAIFGLTGFFPPANLFAVLGNDDNLNEPVIVIPEDVTLCFLAGTLIRTPDGEVPIEALKPGDRVLTPEGPQRVVFLGATTRSTFGLASTGKMPIRLQRDAFGPQLPERDTYCTPSHAFALQGCLIEAQAMVNGSTVTQLQDLHENTVSYYSLELDAHHLIWANGLLSESFIELSRPTGSTQSIRASWNNWPAYRGLHGEARPMAELVMPRIPFSRQLTPELRGMIGLVPQEQTFALVD